MKWVVSDYAGKHVRLPDGRPGIATNQIDGDKLVIWLPNARCSAWADPVAMDPSQLTMLAHCPPDWSSRRPEGYRANGTGNI